jgi:GT2 family glycosyltransferase
MDSQGSPAGSTPPNVSVCVAVWKNHGEPNLATLAASLPASLDGLTGELVVVLNGISPDEVPIPRDAIITAFPVNRGVSVAWNVAGERAAGELLCFINDDATLGPGALRTLWQAATRHPDAGVVGPVGTRWDIARFQHIEYLDTSHLPTGEVVECEVLAGFCLATPRAVFEQAGRFDEAYSPCSVEEVDYCTKVRVELGLKCYAVAGVSYQHVFGISAARPWKRVSWDGQSESIRRIAKRNRRYFMRKWTDKVLAAEAASADRRTSVV